MYYIYICIIYIIYIYIYIYVCVCVYVCIYINILTLSAFSIKRQIFHSNSTRHFFKAVHILYNL